MSLAAVHPELDYDLLEVPGFGGLQIAVIPAMHRSEKEDDVGVRFCEWTVTIDAIFSPKLFVELYGWYAESERETGTDVGNQLFTASRLQHSPLVIVVPCGKFLADFENKMAGGKLIKAVVITHLVRLNGKILSTQINTFENCYVTSVQQYLDYIIVSFRILKKKVICTAFGQDGVPCGTGMFALNYSKPNAESSSLTSLL